jgi:hypothetical protein
MRIPGHTRLITRAQAWPFVARPGIMQGTLRICFSHTRAKAASRLSPCGYTFMGHELKKKGGKAPYNLYWNFFGRFTRILRVPGEQPHDRNGHDGKRHGDDERVDHGVGEAQQRGLAEEELAYPEGV